MGVKAKFKCRRLSAFEGGKEVELEAVYGTEGENKDFTSVTPYGSFKMGISTNSPASEYFEPGEEYYLIIEKAPKN